MKPDRSKHHIAGFLPGEKCLHKETSTCGGEGGHRKAIARFLQVRGPSEGALTAKDVCGQDHNPNIHS